MKLQKFFWLVFAFLFISSFGHELSHAFVAWLLGFEVKGFHFGFPVSYVSIGLGSGSSNNLWLVYWSGGIVDAVALALVWFKGRQYFTFKERTLILTLAVLELAYSFWEAFVYPSL